MRRRSVGLAVRRFAASAWRSIASLRQTPVSKPSLCAYPRVLPRLQRINVLPLSIPTNLRYGIAHLLSYHSFVNVNMSILSM